MRRQSGFTLLEIMVALVVFGLLMAGLSQTVRYGLVTWNVETAGGVRTEDLVAVDQAVRQLIVQAAPGSATGLPDRLAWTTTLPAGAGLADRLADVALRVAPGRRLVLAWRPHPAGPLLGPPAAPREEPLLDNVQAIYFSYLTPQRGGPVWADHWSGDGLPLLVRLGIRFGDNTAWPDLVAAPLEAADTER